MAPATSTASCAYGRQRLAGCAQTAGDSSGGPSGAENEPLTGDSLWGHSDLCPDAFAAGGVLSPVAEGQAVDERHTAPGLILGIRPVRHRQDKRTVIDLDQDAPSAEVGGHRDAEHRAGAVPHRVGDQFRGDDGQCGIGGLVEAEPPLLHQTLETATADRHRGRIADQKEALAVTAHAGDPSTDFRPGLEASGDR